MLIDVTGLDELLETGWLEEIDPERVPDGPEFGYLLKEGAPPDVREKFDYWKALIEWDHNNMVMGVTSMIEAAGGVIGKDGCVRYPDNE
ncbi:MAG: hypothetical protein FWH32_03545 [Clostridiales bacterium]|nr:hypothetical protein [Clostridiales bacterium]